MRDPRSREGLFRLLSVSFGLAAALVIVEVTLRVLGLGYGNAPLNSDPILHHVHPHDYTFLAHDPQGEYGGHPVRYDKEGLVVNPRAPTRPYSGARYRIALMGDSFVEATQVPYTASFAGLLERWAGGRANIRNYGVASYSPIYYLIQWETQVKKFKPTHVFLLLFSNDVRTDKEMARRAIYSKSGLPVAIPGPGGGWLRQRLRRFYVARALRKVEMQADWWLHHRHEVEGSLPQGYVEENPDISKLTARLILSLRDQCGKAGAEFILMAVPSKSRLLQPSASHLGLEFSDKWKSWARENNVTFLDLVAPFQAAAASGQKLFFPRNIHFNENGHRVVAETIREAYPQIFGPAKTPAGPGRRHP